MLDFHKVSIAALGLVCFWASNPLPAEADKLVWQTGRVTDVEELDAGRSGRSDPSCASLQARIYTVETASQILKMLGNMGPSVLPDERSSIRFAVDEKSRAHLFDPNGKEQRVTLIVYESVWKDSAKGHPAIPAKQKSRDWRKAEVKKIEPLLTRVPVPAYGFPYRVACSVSRPVGWIYVVDVGVLTYEAVWRNQTPLNLAAKKETRLAWKGTDRAYLLEADGKERTLPVRERRTSQGDGSNTASTTTLRSKQPE